MTASPPISQIIASKDTAILDEAIDKMVRVDLDSPTRIEAAKAIAMLMAVKHGIPMPQDEVTP